ncbi:MAG: sigma-70 family RNA polymerase sigma factor [Gemmatimonadetes bacterium]|jgi:RNA polymerase sigma-70 factor, ECF subfamily|nr:sigma-70 family RNA polymerase sigma factor [Gemmatimonadota bacterium]
MSSNTSAHDVEILVDRTLAGDHQAFGVLVRRYQDFAYGVAAGILGDPDMGRDVVQEAFIIAFHELPRLREPARFGGWLRMIVQRTSLRAGRELNRLRRMSEELGHPEHIPPPSATPEDLLINDEQHAIVRTAMARLSKNHREVVGLHYMDGLSYVQTAEFLGVTETTVQGRLQRARAQLREILPMVEETFKGQRLADDFAAEVEKVLEQVADDDAIDKRGTVRQLAEMGDAAVEPLCDALEVSTGTARQVALWALCHIGDERACRPVLRLLYARNPWKTWQVSAQAGLMNIPGVRGSLIREVREGRGPKPPGLNPVSDPAQMAVRILSLIDADEEIQDLLAEVFRDAEYRSIVRSRALVGLFRLQPERASEWAKAGLATKDRKILLAVARSGRGDLTMPLSTLVAAFRSGSFRGARFHLGFLFGDANREALREIARTSEGDVHWAAVLALARENDTESLQKLKQEVRQSTTPHYSFEISQVVAQHAGDEVESWIEDGNFEQRPLANLLWGLARSGHEATSEIMAHLANEGTPAVRKAAIRMLTKARGVAYLSELRGFLSAGQHAKVAREAFWQMHAIGSAAEPTARDMLSSPQWAERKAGVCLLRRWGRLTDQEREQALADEHIAVRHGAGAPLR